MNIRFIFFAALFAPSLALMTTGCGGSGSDGNFVPDYAGTWDVQYVFSIDDCQIVLSGVPGFVDQHFIDQAESVVTFAARSGFLDGASAEIATDGSFVVEQRDDGDIFGIGIPCTLTSRVSYEPLDDVSASSQFSQTIVCDDGYACESLARGTALKQPVG